MPARGLTFHAVRAIGRTLPDVEETTSWGVPALKVRGTMFVCMAANKSAEPNTLVVRMDFDQRDALLAEDPDTYYLKEHYVSYPCVLVRLSRVHRDALHDLVSGAWRWIGAKAKTRAPRRRAVSASSRASGSKTRRSRR
jgi:hypothetical protein